MENRGDDPDPSDNGDDEPTDESDDDEEEEEIEEEEEEESEEEQQPPPLPTPEEEAVESFTSSMTSMWDILGNKVSRKQFEAWAKLHLKQLKDKRLSDFRGPYIARGRRGHQGLKGKEGSQGPPGPQGPQGPPGRIGQIYKEPVRESGRMEENISINMGPLEESFREFGNSMKEVWTAQHSINKIMKRQLEVSQEAQETQTQVMRDLRDANNQRNFDYMFSNIKVYNGENPDEFAEWADRLETACMISNRDIREAAIALSAGAVTKVIKSMNKTEPWSVIKAELKRCFSENKTKVHAYTMFNNFRAQGYNENLRSYIYVYTKAHREATGIPAKKEFDIGKKLDFLTRLRNVTIASKIGQSEEFRKYEKYSLDDCFQKALHLESRFQANEMMNMTRENRILEQKIMKQRKEERVGIFDLQGDAQPNTPNPLRGPCYRCGVRGHLSYECDMDKSDGDSGDERIVGKIDHAVQARTYITHKVLNDFIQKATKAEINKKIYQSRLKKAQNQQQQQPEVQQPQQYRPRPFQPKTFQPNQTPVQVPPQPTVQPLQPTAPPMPIQTTQQQVAPKPRGRPRAAGRGKAAGQTTPKTVAQPTTTQAPIVITPTTQPVPPQDIKPKIVPDQVQEIDQDVVDDDSTQMNYDTDEVANLDSESEGENETPPDDPEVVEEEQ